MGRQKNLIPRPCDNLECDQTVLNTRICKRCSSRKLRHGNFNFIPRPRKHFFNQDLLKTETKETSWFLGWCASDGYVSEKKKYVKVEICDKEILENFARIFDYKEEIKVLKPRAGRNNRKQSYQLQLCSKILTEDIVRLGIKQKKSKTIEMPIISDEFFNHFLRGLIEGDGSIWYQKRCLKSLYICLNSASLLFLEQLSDRINLKSNIRRMKPGLYRLNYCGESARELASRIYQDSEGIRLERKYQKYQEHLSYLNNVQ